MFFFWSLIILLPLLYFALMSERFSEIGADFLLKSEFL